MNKPDQWTNIAIWVCILVHVVVLIVGLISNRLSFLSAWLNLIIALSILLYWVQKQLRIEYHIFEIREWIALGMEGVVAATSLYLIITKQWAGGVRILIYIFFGLHLLVSMLMAIFAPTFKMNRLF
jgi:hypothetical protein